MSIIYDLLGIIVAIVVISITFLKWRFTYWNRRGVPSLNPKIPYGDIEEMTTGKRPLDKQIQELYNKFKAKGVPHGGIFMGVKPVYLPLDPELIKQIMVKDFQYFVNRGSYVNEKDDPLSAHLVSLEDNTWRDMRIKLTPAFTSGKMKMMFQTMLDCCVDLKTVLDDAAKNQMAVDIKNIIRRFTCDIIASCGFGLQSNSLKNPNTPFWKYGEKIVELDSWERVKAVMQLILPHNILRAMRMSLTKPEVENFFIETVKETAKYREENNVYRKDLFHLLLQLKNRGTITNDDKVTDGTATEKGLTVNELAAQTFLFFVAGFETSSTATTWTLYELALNTDIQEKLRSNILQVLEKYNGELTYDGIMEMNYLEKVLNESLRKYPPAPLTQRICNKNYPVPNTNVVIEKGTDVLIPIFALHMEPEFYPNPTKFDPERFSEENKRSRHPFTWLPFGEGPRHCIGLRFGVLQSKVALVTLLKSYKIKLNAKTDLLGKIDTTFPFSTGQASIWINIEPLDGIQ